MSIRGLLLVSCFVAASFTTQAAQVSATPVVNNDHSGTADGSAHTVLAGNTAGSGNSRFDCLLQNNGTNVMYYSFAHTATSADFQLQPGQTMNCNNGVVVSNGPLSLIGTNGDTYALTEMFAAAQ